MTEDDNTSDEEGNERWRGGFIIYIEEEDEKMWRACEWVPPAEMKVTRAEEHGVQVLLERRLAYLSHWIMSTTSLCFVNCQMWNIGLADWSNGGC